MLLFATILQLIAMVSAVIAVAQQGIGYAMLLIMITILLQLIKVEEPRKQE